MRNITEKQARRLATEYLNNKNQKYIVYNIRQRSYILHDYYKYFYRFSRRQSVWNTPIFSIDDLMTTEAKSEQQITDVIYRMVNQRVEDILNLKLKKAFTLESCNEMLDYYFNGKCYLAYYDYYLGRIVLIKERDKSNDFGELIGTRYHFIGDLHKIIKKKLELPDSLLVSIMRTLMIERTPVHLIEGIDELNTKLHDYIVNETNKIDEWILETQNKSEEQ